MDYGHRDIVVEKGRSLHMTTHQNLANHLSFGEKTGSGSSSTILEISTNVLEKIEVKERRRTKI